MTNTYSVHCDCSKVHLTMSGVPKVHAFCHCEDCRELFHFPYHSVTAWEPHDLAITKGEDRTISFQHPEKNMTRVFCKQCGGVLYNTHAMGWELFSQLLIR